MDARRGIMWKVKPSTVRPAVAMLYLAYAGALWLSVAGLQAGFYLPGGVTGLLAFLITSSALFLYLWNRAIRNAPADAVSTRWLALVSGIALGATVVIYVTAVVNWAAAQVFRTPWQG